MTEPDGRPLSGVVVAVQGLGLSVATDATGRYVLSRVPAGQQLLQFRRIGFAAREVTVIVTAGTPATADAVLDPQPIDLGTVVVEGVSRAPERMIDAPAAVDVVRPATAEPLSITGQVPLALARVPGLDAYAARIENFTTSMLPGVNPMYPRWTAPPEVPAADRATVESAVRNALAPRGSAVQNGLTRLPDAATAVVLSFANVGTVDEWGVEFGSSISLSRVLTTSASYAWYNSAIRDNVAGNVLSPNTPRNKGVISLTYAGRQGIDVGVDARIVSGYHWTTGLWGFV